MKNFRKVLALVLVVATLFSFTAMTSAANYGEYEDWSKVSYAEAVDVLSAVGILNGYEDDTFKPTNTISREEMAKMIAVLANSGEDVSTLYASACTFADVATTKWSASYVAYCAKTGIVAGRSATTFDPAGKVTGLETAKMLLVVLGFDADEQGYVGADWKVNVLRDAKTMSLLDGFAADYNVEAAITREEAAQMMLNALQAPCVVGVLSDGIVTVTNALIASWNWKAGISELFDISVRGTLKDAIKAGKWCLYGNVVISNDLLVETLFPGLTKVGADQIDCFGRPASEWVWKTTFKTYSLAATVAAPIWEEVSPSATTVANLEKKYSAVGTITEYVDGVKGEDVDGGKGAYVALYATANGYNLVEINTYLGYVGHPNTANGTVNIAGYTVANTYGFKAADEGTAVLYWLCSAEHTAAKQTIHTVEVTEPEVITLHGNRVVAGYFCDSAENKYEISSTATKTAADVVAANLGKDVYVYTDKNGYVLDVATVDAKQTVSVLVGGSTRADLTASDNYGKQYYSYGAKFVEFETGAAVSELTTITKDLFEKDTLSNTLSTEKGYDVLVRWYTSAGKREWVKTADAASDAELREGLLLNEGKGVITQGQGTFKYAGDLNTQYILRLFDADTGKYTYKYFDGADKIDGTYKLNALQYFMAYTASGDISNRYLSYVYADATEAYAPSTAFVLSYATDESYWTGGSEVGYQLYNAVVDGEEAYIAYTDESAEDLGLPTTAGATVYKIVKATYVKVIADTHDDKPIYLASKIEEDTLGEDFVVSGNTLTYKVGSGVIGSAEMAAGATIVLAADYKADNAMGYKDEVIVTSDFDTLINYLSVHGWKTVYGYAATKNGDVTTLYIYAQEV